MVRVSNNGIITVNRGDVFELPLFLNAGTQLHPVRYKLKERDKIYFGVMQAQDRFEDSIIRKVYTKKDLNKYGDVLVRFSSNDTEYLVPGVYYYEIKYEHRYEKDAKSPYVETTGTKKKFLIVE